MKNLISYSKVTPCQDDVPACASIMSKIDDLAPFDSHVDATISLLKDGTFHTVIAITAICGKFKSEAKHQTLVSSLKQAQRSMLTILAEWKDGRFANQVW